MWFRIQHMISWFRCVY